MSPTVLYSSREKTLLSLLFFLALASFGFALKDGLPPIIFGIIEIFSGWMMASSLWLLFRPYRMQLDDIGLTVTGGFRRSPKMIRWQDVETFTFSSGKGRSLGLLYRYGVTPGWWWGPVDELPLGWQRSEQEMADYLNEWRLRATKQPARSG